MTGFDSSTAVVELARRRLGQDADVHVADVVQPLLFTDGSSDDVVASLALHHLRDWTAPLAELRRALEPGGRLITSVHHPITYEMLDPGADCFATTGGRTLHGAAPGSPAGGRPPGDPHREPVTTAGSAVGGVLVIDVVGRR